MLVTGIKHHHVISNVTITCLDLQLPSHTILSKYPM